MNLLVQRKDQSVFLCDTKGIVIAHFPNIINTKNQRALLKAVRVFLKTWIEQLDKNKLSGVQDAIQEVDTLDEITAEDKEDGVKEVDNDETGAIEQS